MPEIQAGKPTGIGIAPDGKVYLADTHYARVLVYSADGEELKRFGTSGEGPGQFLMPTDVAIDADGSLYVSEYGGNDRVSKFSPSGEYLFSFGGQNAGRVVPSAPAVHPDCSRRHTLDCRRVQSPRLPL